MEDIVTCGYVCVERFVGIAEGRPFPVVSFQPVGVFDVVGREEVGYGKGQREGVFAGRQLQGLSVVGIIVGQRHLAASQAELAQQ